MNQIAPVTAFIYKYKSNKLTRVEQKRTFPTPKSQLRIHQKFLPTKLAFLEYMIWLKVIPVARRGSARDGRDRKSVCCSLNREAVKWKKSTSDWTERRSFDRKVNFYYFFHPNTEMHCVVWCLGCKIVLLASGTNIIWRMINISPARHPRHHGAIIIYEFLQLNDPVSGFLRRLYSEKSFLNQRRRQSMCSNASLVMDLLDENFYNRFKKLTVNVFQDF